MSIDISDKIDICAKNVKTTHPSLESRIPWRTDLNALAAVALMHIINPNK